MKDSPIEMGVMDSRILTGCDNLHLFNSAKYFHVNCSAHYHSRCRSGNVLSILGC
jgi:hypothetical protein